VPFVQVNWSDTSRPRRTPATAAGTTHRNFQIMQDRHAPWLDQGLSALFDDLSEHGLLDSTLVIVAGEFGRSPKINTKAGREHWPQCYSALVGGGGWSVAGDRSSDSKGERPARLPADAGGRGGDGAARAGVTSEQAAELGSLAVASDREFSETKPQEAQRHRGRHTEKRQRGT